MKISLIIRVFAHILWGFSDFSAGSAGCVTALPNVVFFAVFIYLPSLLRGEPWVELWGRKRVSYMQILLHTHTHTNWAQYSAARSKNIRPGGKKRGKNSGLVWWRSREGKMEE